MITFTFVIIERVGRRKGLIYGAALGCIPMWYIGGYVMRADPAAAAATGAVNRDFWGYLAMVCVYLNGFIICATWQGITWTYASEIFPLDIRMLCVSSTTAVTWLGSFIIVRIPAPQSTPRNHIAWHLETLDPRANLSKRALLTSCFRLGPRHT